MSDPLFVEKEMRRHQAIGGLRVEQKDWDEDKHPRDHGKFTSAGDGGEPAMDHGEARGQIGNSREAFNDAAAAATRLAQSDMRNEHLARDNVREITKASEWSGQAAAVQVQGREAATAYGAENRYGGSVQPPGVNWSSSGTDDSPDSAREHAAAIAQAAQMAEYLEPMHGVEHQADFVAPAEPKNLTERQGSDGKYSAESREITATLPSGGSGTVRAEGPSAFHPEGVVGWSAHGTQSTRDAVAYSKLIEHAADLAGTLKPEPTR